MKSQLWMMLNGVMDAPLKEFSCVTISDWEGNTVCVPIVSSLTLIFSILSILKACSTVVQKNEILRYNMYFI